MTLTEAGLVNLGQTLRSSWPSFLPPLADESLLDAIWAESLEPTPTHIRSNFVFDQDIALSVPGLDAVALTIGASTGGTRVQLEVTVAPTLTARLIDVPLGLRLSRDLLMPARPVAGHPGAFEADPTRETIDIPLGRVTLTVDGDGNLGIAGGLILDLPLCMIGDSGVVVEATGITVHLDGTAPPPGKPAGWKGLHIPSAALHLPADLSATVGTLSLADAYIGNGGFSGTVAVDFAPAKAATLFGMQVTLEHAGVSFVQNALTGSEIRGTLRLPFFDEPIAVTIGLGLDGHVAVALRGGPNGLLTLTKPGILTLQLDSLGFALEGDIFVAKLSGTLRPDVGDLAWPGVQVQELSIDSAGNVKLDGGWLDLNEGYTLDLYGFQFEITKLGLGSTADGGKWVGFSGGLKLVDGMKAGASVEGLRVNWYPDRPPSLTLNGVGVEFEVPGVLSFKGSVSYRDLPGGVHRFDGSIRLVLTTLDLEVDGQLVIGYDSDVGYAFFAIYLGVELPAGIPLWTTGLGLYGLAGLFALNMEPDKGPTEPWYGMGPGEGWYKKPQVGVTDLVKWRNELGSLGVGAGVTIGTVADNGFTFAGRFLLAVVFPGPILFIEGKANLLAERSSLADDPMMRALAVIDGREGSFLVGLDAKYAFAVTGEVIDVSGSAEAFFDFDDPMKWHLYLGMKDPRERRIRAEIFFHLWEANAYFMLDAHQLAVGAYVGYHNSWRFGPVRAGLEAWIEGDALVSFKPVHFHGELWLHGKVEFSVFGFGFDIGADARVSADVFNPYALRIEIAAHLGLPWPLPDFDPRIVIEFGPETTPPPLPMPLKELAVEHFKVTTSWPLPRTSSPALHAPDYDSDKDGFLQDPSPVLPAVLAAAPPANAPVVPLDSRPHVTFGRTVHDDAMVGINPQPPLPQSTPPGWEWIGDPLRNEGPVRLRTGLREVAVERWSGGVWVPVARKGPDANPAGVQALHGSWAPQPQLPGGEASAVSPAPAGNTKLWLWSRSAFDYTRHTTGKWEDWWVSAFPRYPCVDIPEDQEICCDFGRVKPGTNLVSPWRCPEAPDFPLGWETAPNVREGRSGTLFCFGAYDSVVLRLGRPAKSVRLHFENHPAEEHKDCLDLRAREVDSLPNPYSEAGFRFTVRDGGGGYARTARIVETAESGVPVTGLDVGFSTEVVLPYAAELVELTLVSIASPAKVTALDASGNPLDQVEIPGGTDAQLISLRGPTTIRTVLIEAPQDETALLTICVWGVRGGLLVTGIDRAGRQGSPVPVVDGVAEFDASDLVDVLVEGQGSPFCLSGFCVVVGLSPEVRLLREQLSQHVTEETARWQQSGFVLEPYASYRLRVVTTLETRDFAHDAGFNKVREQTEIGYFRTEGPPGVGALSVPINTPKPAEFASGLDDLTRYVTQTVPPTVPPPGQKPLLPRPVFRAYDVGVSFNEDYVDLLYRSSGRDLGLYLYDTNNAPARDVFGRLLTMPNRWGRAESLQLSRSDSNWVATVNASTCATIDESLIVRARTLSLGGQVLDADRVYSARLVPLLLHETFAGYPVGATGVGPTGNLRGTGGGWVVQDTGTTEGPSRWVVREGGTPVTRYVEQQSNVWGGPDNAADPTNPGTVLLRADDRALAASSPDQPGNWTDYRMTAVLRSGDDDAIGLVVRHRGPGDHYLFAMDRQRGYRRLVRVTGGDYTVLAADASTYLLDSDVTINVEAVGDRLRVFQDGDLLFDVIDSTHHAGRVGLYCWANTSARFADVRVDDFRSVSPVVYAFDFTTSRFADFFHQIADTSGETWPATLADPAVAVAAVAVATPLAGLPATTAEAEARAYQMLATAALGQAAYIDAPRVEASVLVTEGSPAALLLRTAEPIDWSRTGLQVTRCAGTTPAYLPMIDRVAAGGEAVIAGWSSSADGAATPISESVTVLFPEQVAPDGWRVEYRTLPSAEPADQPDGTVLAEEQFLGFVDAEVTDGAPLFQPTLDDLVGFTVHDPRTLPRKSSAWQAAAGVITQSASIGGLVTLGDPVAQPGTQLVAGEPEWRDYAFTVRLRTDAATGAVGAVFRYVDQRNFYRFSLEPAAPARRLVACVGGVFTVLWADAQPVSVGQDYDLRVEAVGGRLRVLLDGVELSDVLDTSHPTGLIGLYSFLCDAAIFSQVSVIERGGHLPGWDIFDVGALDSSSSWRQEGGALLQSAAIAGAGAPTADPASAGSYAVTGTSPWTDITLRVDVELTEADAIGVVLRWQGPEDHLLLVLDARSSTLTLLRKRSGSTSVLWSGSGAVPLNAWHRVEVETIGTRVRAGIGGVPLFDLHDADVPAAGRAGVFVCAAAGGRFASFTVMAAAPRWTPYAHFTGIGPIAGGRRVRLLAGRELENVEPPVTGEIRRFQGIAPGNPAGVRLPVEGVDLRLIAPDGRTIHARRFPPDAAFVSTPLHLLRAQDGTGLILTAPDAAAPGGSRLKPGVYRLSWTYRRDNRSVQPDSQVLRENGDSTPELVQMDVRL